MNQKKQVYIKKVKPYPFAAVLEGNGAKSTVQVVRLFAKGLIVDLGSSFLKVGEEKTLSFELPVRGSVLQSLVKVVKTYDQLRTEPASPATPSSKVQRLAELYFISLTDRAIHEIHQFLSSIGQI